MAEEEERRLLMPASGGCFRFMVDVERLSTEGEEDRQTRGRGLHWSQAAGGGASGAQGSTRLYRLILLYICNRERETGYTQKLNPPVL